MRRRRISSEKGEGLHCGNTGNNTTGLRNVSIYIVTITLYYNEPLLAAIKKATDSQEPTARHMARTRSKAGYLYVKYGSNGKKCVGVESVNL